MPIETIDKNNQEYGPGKDARFVTSVVEWVTWDITVMLELTNEINIKILKTLSHAHSPAQESLL